MDNIVVASAVVNPDESRGGGGGGGGSGTLTEVLLELQAAFQQGLLTKEEFEAAKEKALESMIRGGTASGYVQAAVAEPAEAQPSRVIVSGAGDHSFDGEYVRDEQGGTGSGRGDVTSAWRHIWTLGCGASKGPISIWRPQLRAGDIYFGDVALTGSSCPATPPLVINDRPAFIAPVGFKRIWEQQRGGAVYIWAPVPPSDAFVALGDVATTSSRAPSPSDFPGLRCVSRAVLQGTGPCPHRIWSDEKTGGPDGCFWAAPTPGLFVVQGPGRAGNGGGRYPTPSGSFGYVSLAALQTAEELDAGARFRNQEMQEEMPRSAAMERGDVFDRSRYPNGGPRGDQKRAFIGITFFCLPNMIMCPLHCFSMCGCADLVGCLTSLPCSAIPCTPCDPNGKQPLWFRSGCLKPIGYAASFGQLHTVMELVKNGANPHRRNGTGENAWSDARRERHQHVVDWLDAWQAAGSPRRGALSATSGSGGR